MAERMFLDDDRCIIPRNSGATECHDLATYLAKAWQSMHGTWPAWPAWEKDAAKTAPRNAIDVLALWLLGVLCI